MDLPAFLVHVMDVHSVQGKDLAHRLGVQPSFVSQVRLGRRPIAPEAIIDWIRALDLSGAEAEEFRVLALLQQAPPELRSYVHDLRRQLARLSADAP